MFNWHEPTVEEQPLHCGPLPLIIPLLQKLNITNIIDQHLPPDPQLAFSHGRVLSLLMAARMCQPTALVNIPDWAEETGADLLWGIPSESLNDDRLGRALDAFFTQRHSILASVAHQAIVLGELSTNRLHFDTTHIYFYGDYGSSQPRPDNLPWPPRDSSFIDPSHITHGHGHEKKVIQVGFTSIVDEMGAVPILAHCLDGNQNGHKAIKEQCEWLRSENLLKDGTIMVSDRGTFSQDHVLRLNRYQCQVLCAVPWSAYKKLYDENRDSLDWRRASYQSLEQQRRSQTNSSLPLEYYDIAAFRQDLTDPLLPDPIYSRLIFVYSSADAKICRLTRENDIVRLKAGLADIARTVARGSSQTTPATIAKRVTKLFGNREAAKYFHWEMIPLTEEEQAAMPESERGCCRPKFRFHYEFDEAAAAEAEEYDGLSVLLTTAKREYSCDRLFTMYKEQNYVELCHHQWKTPLAVRPVFLKSPRRVEALLCLMQLALTAFQMLERLYRKSLGEDATKKEKHRTAESLFRTFKNYNLIGRQMALGQVVLATRLKIAQRQIINQLGFPSPAQLLAQLLPPLPMN